MVKVSVIIPVYNAEDYLAECLDSVINQTLNDLEVICVNDGSTDNSLNILNDYAFNDCRIKIVSQENQGQGVARNNGLDLIKGDYFCFLDADDKLELNTIETCYNLAIKNSLDMVMYKLINYDDSSKEFYTTPGYDMYYLYSKVRDHVFNFNDLGETIFYVSVSPANKLFNTRFVLDSCVKFPKGTIFEDNIFFWRLFFNAKRIMFCNEYFYIRRRHSSSTTGFGGERWVDAIEIYNKVWDVFKEYGLFEKFKTRLYNNKIEFGLFRLDNINEDFKDFFLDAWREDLINIKNSHYDFYELLYEKNKQIFELVLNSENYEEFLMIKNYYDLSNQIKNLELKNLEINESFNNLVNMNNDLLSSNRVNDELNTKNQELNKLNDNLVIMNNDLLSSNRVNDELNLKIYKLYKENLRLTEENKYLRRSNYENNELIKEFLSSNSWKLTASFRKLGQKFRK